jgi:hypothetical protein
MYGYSPFGYIPFGAGPFFYQSSFTAPNVIFRSLLGVGV